jgi:RND family efflux transporter MFP subunit
MTMRFRWEYLVMAALAALTAWMAIGKRVPVWLGDEQEIAAHVAAVGNNGGAQTIRLNGVLMPVNEVQAVSQLAGRVSELRVRPGDPVRAGEVVATVHASAIVQRQAELEAAAQAARRDLAVQEQRRVSLEQAAAQRRELWKQDLIARRELEQADAALDTARAETELARAHLAQQEAMLAQALAIQSLSQITAPSAGVISRRWVTPGATIAAGSPLVSIANASLMKFAGRTVGRAPPALREGLRAVVSTDENAEGIVSRVIANPAQTEASSDVEIQFNNTTAKLRVGMAASAEITLARAEPRLIVPRSAVFENADGVFVYKLVAGRAVRQAVSLGPKAGDSVIVEQGLNAGDLVIVDQLHLLKPSIRVRALARAPGS